MRYKHIIIVGASLITMLCLLSGLMCYLNQDECPIGTFPCFNSTICKPQRNWCDGESDCPYGDDESDRSCHDFRESFEETRPWTNWPKYGKISLRDLNNNSLTHLSRDILPRYSNISYLRLDDSNITKIEKEAFFYQSEVFFLILTNNSINEILPGHLIGLNELRILLLDGNKIEFADFSDLENGGIYFMDLCNNMLKTSTLKLPRTKYLAKLILDRNHFDSITEDIFAGCPKLELLGMEHNDISSIDENAFRTLLHLKYLYLAYNRIVTIPSNVFQHNVDLRILLIGYNPITKLQKKLFNPLSNLKVLDVRGINMDKMDENAFDVLPNLNFIYFAKFHYCMTYAPKVQKCRPTSDGTSSMSHLLNKPLLRAAVWGISFVTCLGNSLVLWGRFTAKDENRVLSITIGNLAVSDMLMGIYLFIIAIIDASGSYKEKEREWMSSWPCAFLGALAMTSSEVSMFIISFMSVERFIVIAAPWGHHRGPTSQTAFSLMIVIWIIGLILAIVPVIYWRSSTRFYGVNGMCFPLHIDDPYLIGWQYSAFIFLGLNLIGLIIISYVYIAMFISIWKTRRGTPLSDGESELALRFFLIVLTDAICWAPIIALKILAIRNYPVPSYLHAWIMTFLLPVNSAINPLLYTFTTRQFRERFNKSWCGKVYNSFIQLFSKRPGQDTINLEQM